MGVASERLPLSGLSLRGGGPGGAGGAGGAGSGRWWSESVRRRLAVSFAVWLGSYYLMAVLGGSVAFYRFPRQSTNDPEPYTLLDVGFELLPEFCPKHVIPLLHVNFQSVVLVIFYSYALLWSGRRLFCGDELGAVMLVRFFLLNSLVFVTRTSVVGLTALPQPNFGKHCSNSQTEDVTYWEAVVDVCGQFPPKACGDLIYSGHVACAFSALFIFDSLQAYPPSLPGMPFNLPRLIFYVLGAMAIISCLMCRSHYTVDVVLGVYFAYFLSIFYLQRAEGVVDGGRLGALIRSLDCVSHSTTVGHNADKNIVDEIYCPHGCPLTPTDSESAASTNYISPEGYGSIDFFLDEQNQELIYSPGTSSSSSHTSGTEP